MGASERIEQNVEHPARLGHANRHVRLRDDCTGLILPRSHKSAEPMTARIDPLLLNRYRASGRRTVAPRRRRRRQPHSAWQVFSRRAGTSETLSSRVAAGRMGHMAATPAAPACR